MPTTGSASFNLLVILNEFLASGFVAAPGKHTFDTFASVNLANGTASGQADRIWSSKDRSLSASAGENHDFAAGITDSFGAAITMAKLKLLCIHNSGSTSIRLSRPASGIPLFSGTTDGFDLPAGGVWFFYDADGVTVTAGTGDLFRVLNNDGAVAATYSILAAGTSV